MEQSLGQALHDPDAERRREAARALGQAKTPRKSQSSAARIAEINERKRTEGVSEETRAKLRQAQAARREREKQERADMGSAPVEAKAPGKPGRPRKTPVGAPQEPKRGRGRPKKADALAEAKEGQAE